MKEEIEIEVRGRVQGIRFRKMIKRFADSTDLKGFVMNKKDGSVLTIAQGTEKDTSGLLIWIQKNPGFSKIESLSYKKRNAMKDYPDFKIIKEKNFLVDKAISIINLGKSLIAHKKSPVPLHIAIIPDGNRRWAKSKGLESTFGHYKAGAYNNIEELFREGMKAGVKYMSIWGFSTENWKRSKKEQEEIFSLINSGVDRFIKDANKNKIRFRHIGRKDRLPKALISNLTRLEELTKNHSDFNVQLCLDYGGRDELIRAVNKILKSKVKKIGEKDFSKFLDTQDIPDPDLIIRTSGENRISGLMPFQSTYAELYFSKENFPDFKARELRQAIQEFGDRNRRFGGN